MTRFNFLRIALLLLFLFPGGVKASEVRLIPSVAVSQEVNDNIREVPEPERFELVTRVQPGAALHYQGGQAALDASYTLDYRYYARHTRGSEFNHLASLNGATRFFDDFLTVEGSESFTRVSLDLARQTVEESVLVNQTDQNVASFSPYLTWRIGDKGTLRTGYRFSDIRYWHSSAVDKEMHSLFAQYQYQLSERLGLTAGYTLSRIDSAINDYLEHDLSAGMRYQYGEKSFLFGSVGNSWLDFSGGRSTSNLFWDAGVTHDFGVAVATLQTRVQYTEDPLTLSTKETSYGARLEKILPRGRVALAAGHSEYEATQGGRQDRRQTQITVSGDHELLTELRGGISLTGERLGGASIYLNLPYHLVATGTLGYTLGQGTTLGLTYSHISYWHGLDDRAGAVEVNRGVVEIRKTF